MAGITDVDDADRLSGTSPNSLYDLIGDSGSDERNMAAWT
jgi:hypothetical protein